MEFFYNFPNNKEMTDCTTTNFLITNVSEHFPKFSEDYRRLATLLTNYSVIWIVTSAAIEKKNDDHFLAFSKCP